MSDYQEFGEEPTNTQESPESAAEQTQAIPTQAAQGLQQTQPMQTSYQTQQPAPVQRTPYTQFNQQPQQVPYGQQQAPQHAAYQQPYQQPYQQQPRGYQPPASPQQPAYAAPAQPVKAQKSGGSAKTFLLAFLGAALACILAILIYQFAIVPATSSSSSTGTTTTSTITVSGEDTDLAEAVASKCTPSVCCIYVYTQESSVYDMLGYGSGSSNSSNSGSLTESSLGSGVILTSDGYVLTNYHVIEDAAALKVSANGTEYDAEVVGTDESSDLAVIKLTNASGLTPIEIGDSDSLTQGQWVMTIGSPFGLESSVATGIISATSRSQVYEDSSSSYYYGSGTTTTTVYANMIQTDAAINPGNSGGALVDENGKLLGINTLITSYSGNYSGVGFAIPVNYAYSIAQQLINGETPSHAQLGVNLVSITSSIAKQYNLPVESGAYLSSVSANSAAANAGLQVGDIITKVDDDTIASASDLMIAVREHSVGDKITVTYYRDNAEQTVEVTLGSDTDSSSSASGILQNGLNSGQNS